jgi:hypothetical protein
VRIDLYHGVRAKLKRVTRPKQQCHMTDMEIPVGRMLSQRSSAKTSLIYRASVCDPACCHSLPLQLIP